MKNFNLFCGTRSLTNSHEDHLTEFFAACLLVSPCFSQRFVDNAIKPFAEKNQWQGWQDLKIKFVETQVSYESGSTPDMRLTFNNDRILLIENKLKSLEGGGIKEVPEKKQLSRYLELPCVDGVLYIRANQCSPSDEVRDHPKYVSPESGRHFLWWKSIYPLFEDIEHDIVRWVKEGFEQIGYTPPTEEIGDLNDSDDKKKERNRTNFAKHWLRTCKNLGENGWSDNPGAISELYLEHKDAKIPKVWISPHQSNTGDRFVIRVYPSESVPVEKIKSILNGVEGVAVSFRIEEGIATKQKVRVVDIAARLWDIVEGSEDKGAALHDFVTPFVLAIGENLKS